MMRSGRAAWGAFMAGAAIIVVLVGCESSTTFIDPANPERMLLDEDFTTNARNWFTGTREGSYRFEFLDGQYRLQSWNDTGVMSVKSIPLPEHGAFSIEVTLVLREAGDDLGHGFCWGGRGAANRTCFFVSGDGAFTVFRRVDGEISDLVPWKPSAWLIPGANTLEVKKVRGDLECRINGHLVARAAHAPFAGDEMGFAGDGRLDFSVDRLLILTE